jgi:hypothetical protein
MPLPRSFTKLHVESADLNRVQANVAAAIDPVLRVLPPGIGDRPRIIGSRGGNAALASLLSALDAAGIIVDETT